jgi:hypothetical protein
MNKKTDQEYKNSLSDIQYRVTREAATEGRFLVNSGITGLPVNIAAFAAIPHYFNHQLSLMLGVAGLATTHQRKKRLLLKFATKLME